MTKNSHILRLREYESATIGSEWDASRKVVPPYVVAELERLQAEQRTEYIAISRRRIKAQNYVGVIGVGDRSIEILPKTDEADDSARRRLVQMMSLAGMLPHLEAGIADLAPSVPCLLDAFMQAYTRQLALEWRRGRISSYQKTDENRTCLRGKLLFHEQIRRNRLRPERFFTRADQFITDVPPCRLLKAGLDVCRRYGTADATRRGATTLLAEFDEVANHSFTDAELDAVKPDRRIERFDPLLTLAKRFVRGRVPDRPGGAATYSLLFDMNVVFERYIGCLLRRACPSPYRVQLQVTGRSLVLRDGKRKFWLRPDVAVRHGKQFSILIDTKWKLLDLTKSHEGVRQSDMYQAYAYAREFESPHVILLYPRFGDLGQKVAGYRLPPGDDSSSRIDVATVDVTQPTSQVRHELEDVIAKALKKL
jgi:5-methylcytosine-specific restriction enzyme subunit McrC